MSVHQDPCPGYSPGQSPLKHGIGLGGGGEWPDAHAVALVSPWAEGFHTRARDAGSEALRGIGAR